MTIRVLLIEDDPGHVRAFRAAFDRARREGFDVVLDSVISFGGYLRAADRGYDAYILDDMIADRCNAFEKIAPLLASQFPGAAILHNSGNADKDDILRQERRLNIKFARDAEGNAVACNKNPAIALEYIKDMLAEKGKRPRSLRPKARVSIAPPQPRRRNSIPPQ